MQVEVEARIARPAEGVFDYLADFSNNPHWQSGMRSATWTTPPPLAVGSRYVQVASFLGRPVESTFQVVAFEPGRRVRIESVSGTFPITVTRQVEPDGDGARVRALVEGGPRGPLRYAAPLFAILVRWSVAADYARLKRLLEAEG